MKKILGGIMFVILVLLLIDFVSFIGWVYSGQIPVDNFYFGSITKHILQFIFY